MSRTRIGIVLATAALLTGCGGGDRATPAATPAPGTAARTETIATGLEVPWGIAFLPDGDALVSERDSGRILRVPATGGDAREVMKVPGVSATGESGLLGLAVSPDYARDGLVYAYLTTNTDNRIVRFQLGGALQPIVTGLKAGAVHDGGRIAFGPDGKLYAGVGETGDPSLAQDESSRNGKILRVEPDGSVPPDNPSPDSPVWSSGHRNVQGVAWDAADRMWATEFGQNTFDEVNLIRAGANYGWPVVEGEGDTDGGRYTNPLVTWATSDASPSGAAIVGETLYVGALQGESVLRVRLSGESASKAEPLLEGVGRIRTVVAAPDGALWVSTSNTDGRGDPRDGDDRIVRVSL
jgi:glucose/arabinose dehydrogenase